MTLEKMLAFISVKNKPMRDSKSLLNLVGIK